MRPSRPRESGAKLGLAGSKRNRLTGVLIALRWLFALVSTRAATNDALASENVIEQLFSDYRSNGTLIIKSQRSGKVWMHDEDRSKRRYIPASTFKIPNTLIALDTGVATSAGQLFKWDGVIRWLNKWNQDLTLKQAFRASSVPVYQRIAKQIGPEQMKAGLARLDYENQQIGNTIDRFWLDGPLKISAELSRSNLMERIASSALPFSTEHQTILEGGDGRKTRAGLGALRQDRLGPGTKPGHRLVCRLVGNRRGPLCLRPQHGHDPQRDSALCAGKSW